MAKKIILQTKEYTVNVKQVAGMTGLLLVASAAIATIIMLFVSVR